MKQLIYLLVLLPVFSVTEILRLPRLNNVVLIVVVVGLIVLVSKKIRIDENFIYSWVIGLGLTLSIIFRFMFTGDIKNTDLIFPLLWIFFPLFLLYWERFNVASRIKFSHWLFFLNFTYAFIQIILSRFLNYSLMIHRTFSDYKISNFSQDSPFSYLGLNNIHQFISSHLGAVASGLLIERVDLALLCILCIFQSKIFNNKRLIIPISKQSKFYRYLRRINVCLSLILLTITGSSLSIAVLIFPVLILINYLVNSMRIKFVVKLFKNNLSKKLGITIQICLGLIMTYLFFIFLIPIVASWITFFDASTRISSIVLFDSLSKNFGERLDILFFGAGTVTTSDIEAGIGALGWNLTEDSLLPRSLDILGYTFNSFGLFGFLPFILCYPLLLNASTTLNRQTIISFCLFSFAGAGSPISYIYVYGIILSRPKKLSKTKTNNLLKQSFI